MGVEAIMGCPANDDTTGETEFAEMARNMYDDDAYPPVGAQIMHFGFWFTDTVSFTVALDASDKVVYRAHLPIRKVTPVASLFRRAERQLRRWFPE